MVSVNTEASRETLVVMHDARQRESGLESGLDSYPGYVHFPVLTSNSGQTTHLEHSQVPSRDYYPYLFSQPNLAVERFWDNVPKYRDPELEEEKPSN